ncbi:conserved hypothetical protein [Enhydrobacter sp. 8BJ]|nr:BrnT family toxin [Enhydrobacter sp. 8BJ]VXB20143.1 conserved hypothetical protein [Enhydrobacter sp. 8BJ]
MDKQLDFDYIRFEWDISKNTSNQTKHGLSFELAIYAFFDEQGVSERHQIVDGEQRWRTLGMIDGCVVVFVGHLTHYDDKDTEVVRIITARKATKQEEREYYGYR